MRDPFVSDCVVVLHVSALSPQASAAKDFLTNIKFVKKKINKNTINKYLNLVTDLLYFFKSLNIKKEQLQIPINKIYTNIVLN